MRRLWHLFVLVAGAALLLPQAAFGLTIDVPRHVLRTADITVVTASTDPTGTLTLAVDGTVVKTVSVVPSSSVTVSKVSLRRGTRRVSAVITPESGMAVSTSKPVTSWYEPGKPRLLTPTGGRAAKKSPIVLVPGGSTNSIKVSVNGKSFSTKSVTTNVKASFGTCWFSKSTNTITVKSVNPVASKTFTYRVRRLSFPWATCIVIDKSDFKLYWVKDNVLVKTYPIAHGKPYTPTPSATWRVDAKHYSSPTGIYGPRKLRLYRKVGKTSYKRTGYLIHGTNEPWVIGTRASHGCIRMYNKDVLDLFPRVPLGTMVQTRL